MFSSHCTLLPRDDVRTLIFMYLLEICSSGRQNHNVLISSEKKKKRTRVSSCNSFVLTSKLALPQSPQNT